VVAVAASGDYTPASDATYYRTALLLGLVRARTVQDWAEQVLAEGATDGAIASWLKTFECKP
jgi:hypothetical protein